MKAVVVGGGPAGLSAAIGLRRLGHEVTLHESSEGQPRVCGAFLNPEALSHLEWLGVAAAAIEHGVPVRDVVLSSPEQTHPSYPIGQNGKYGLALPRPELEHLLKDRFIQLGGKFENKRLRNLEFSNEAEIIVIAGGRFSGYEGAGKGLALRNAKHGGGWYGWNAQFVGAPQNPGALSLHFYEGGYVGTLSFKDGRTNVCGLVHKKENHTLAWQSVFEQALERQPQLKNYLAGAKRVSEWRGVGPLPYQLGIRTGNGAILAGDAAAVGDPFMGEGIGRALGSGPLIYAARANVAVYERLWKTYYTRRLQVGWLARELIKSPLLFDAAIGTILSSNTILGYISRSSHVGFQPKSRLSPV